MHVLVVIVNYRTAALAEDCVRSLWRLQSRTSSLRIAIVDNCSGDGSAERLRSFVAAETGPWPVQVLASPVNGGFAAGNNVALSALVRAAPRDEHAPDVVWLLNPDTVVTAGDLDAMIAFLGQRPQIGILGTRLVDAQGHVQCSAFRRHTWTSELESALSMGPVSRLLRTRRVAPPAPDAPAAVDWVSGASMLLRREVIDRVGLLDDAYFMYFEETDYCLAAGAAGFEVWHWPHFVVAHFEGAASGVRAQSRSRRPRYWFDSRARFFRKNYSAAYLHLANVAWVAAYPLGRAWQWLRGRRCADPPRLWLDFIAANYLPPRR